MKVSKWTFYQLLGLIALIILFYFTEGLRKDFAVSPSGKFAVFSIAAMIFVLVTWLYIIFCFQLKKTPNIMKHKAWRMMPFIIIVIGLISIVMFIFCVTMGPDWIGQWKGLLYVSIMYFMILFYFFVISIVHKLSGSNEHVIHHSYLWTVGLLLVAIFLI